MFHQEADRIPAFAATEAFIQFFGRRDRKGWGFFIVKRAETDVVASPFFQFYKPANDLDNIEPVEDLLYGIS